MAIPLALLLALFLPAALFFLITYTKHEKSSSKLLPPSPPKLPIIGNLHQLWPLPHRSLHALAQQYGPIISLKIGSIPTIIVSSAAGAQEIFKTQDLVFSGRPQLEIVRRVFNGRDIAFSQPTEYWREARKVSIVHLLSAKKVKSFRSSREEEVALLVDQLISRSSDTTPVNLSELLNYHTSYLISRVVLGKKYTDYGGDGSGSGGGVKFCSLVNEISIQFGGFYVRDYFPNLGWWSKLSGADARVHGLFTGWNNFLEEVIRDHEGSSTSSDGDGDGDGDLVDVLLALHKEQKLTKKDVKAILLTMFSAGTEPSYVAIEWTMAELVRNPELMKRVQEDIREVAAGKATVDDDDIDRMGYLKAVIKETLRLHPPSPLTLPHESREDAILLGYEVPAGTRVVVNLWSIGRNPEYWDDPEEFRPERFIKSQVDFKGRDFHLIPFGAGRRVCPGMNFSVSTIELALANLLYQFDWKLPDGKGPMDMDMGEIAGISTRMKSNLILLAKPHIHGGIQCLGTMCVHA